MSIKTSKDQACQEADERCSWRMERGFSLVELMVAMTILAIGMIGLAPIFATAVMSNSRSRGDTAGTMLAQTVLEKLYSQPANLFTPLTIADCNPAGPTNWTIANAAGGSPLDSNGAIDFTAATVANYSMQFASCGSGGRQVVYDVRWNVQTISASTRAITVSARAIADAAAPGTVQALRFNPPITLRAIGGVH